MFNGIRSLLLGPGQRENRATQTRYGCHAADFPPGRRVSQLDELATYLRDFRIQETKFGVRVILIDDDSRLRGDVFYSRDDYSFKNLGSQIAAFAEAVGATAFFVVVNHQQDIACFTPDDFLLAEKIYKGASWLDVLMIDYLVVGKDGINSRLFGKKVSPFVCIDQDTSF